MPVIILVLDLVAYKLKSAGGVCLDFLAHELPNSAMIEWVIRYLNSLLDQWCQWPPEMPTQFVYASRFRQRLAAVGSAFLVSGGMGRLWGRCAIGSVLPIDGGMSLLLEL